MTYNFFQFKNKIYLQNQLKNFNSISLNFLLIENDIPLRTNESTTLNHSTVAGF
jgi:hypothetical protein